jgi:hypothetical protein
MKRMKSFMSLVEIIKKGLTFFMCSNLFILNILLLSLSLSLSLSYIYVHVVKYVRNIRCGIQNINSLYTNLRSFKPSVSDFNLPLCVERYLWYASARRGIVVCLLSGSSPRSNGYASDGALFGQKSDGDGFRD